MPISVTRHVEFEAAHMLYKYDGACKNTHGHSYKLEVTVTGELSKDYGFVIDFKVLDKIIKAVIPDHMFITNKNLPENCTERQIVNTLKKNGMAIKEYDFIPSAENMVANFANEIQKKLPAGCTVVETKLWETSNSYATWKPDN